MWGNSKKRKVTQIDSLIGQDTEITGDILFSGGLHIDGTVKGNVIAEEGTMSVLTLSEQGSIEGEVRVPNMILNGTVTGNVYAIEHIELAPKSRIIGDVYYGLIEMTIGAEVNGSLVHTVDSSNALLEHQKSAKDPDKEKSAKDSDKEK